MDNAHTRTLMLMSPPPNSCMCRCVTYKVVFLLQLCFCPVNVATVLGLCVPTTLGLGNEGVAGLGSVCVCERVCIKCVYYMIIDPLLVHVHTIH